MHMPREESLSEILIYFNISQILILQFGLYKYIYTKDLSSPVENVNYF